MASRPGKGGPRPLSAILGAVLDPVCARRGFGAASLIAAWREVVGPRYADCTMPEKIGWPRGPGSNRRAGVLTIGVLGSRAVYLQHEIPEIRQRINAFLGYAAIGEIRLTPRPARPPEQGAGRTPPAPRASAAAVDAALAGMEPGDLRQAMRRLAEHVLADRLAQP